MTIKNNTVVLTHNEVAVLNDYQKSELELALQSAGYTLIVDDRASR